MTWENRLIFEVSSADPDSDTPVWVDLTSRILDVVQLVEVGIGRQNDLEQAEPTTWTMVLNNADDALTFGNTASPYAAWWAPGRKCRLREAIGGTVLPVATGYLQVPTETVALAGIDQQVSVSIVDRLGRLAAGQPFPSALGAYILNTADLAIYFPMTEAQRPFRQFGPTQPTLALEVDLFTVLGSNSVGSSCLTQQGVAPPGSESSGAKCRTGKDGTGAVTSYCQLAIGPGGSLFIPLDQSSSFTMVMWLAVTGTTRANQYIAAFGGTGSTGAVDLTLIRDVTTGVWTLTSTGAMMAGSVSGGAPGDGALLPVGMKFNFASPTLELWIGGQRFTTVPAVTPPVGLWFMNYALIGGSSGAGGVGPDYDVSHIQIYNGTTYGYSDFLAQLAQGYMPLQRQTTGARVRTIARYAGIPAAELTQIDTGSSVMQTAVLAGKTPLEAMREAERTEQGLLYVDGSGSLIFKDRRSLYNI